MKYQKWIIEKKSEKIYTEMRANDIPPLVAAVLSARGVSSVQEASKIYSCSEEKLKDPFLMKDMNLAVARIQKALDCNEKIAIYGDYDVDGITSTCLLTHYLRKCGGDVQYYIPSRMNEGYGINNAAVAKLAASGVTLIITVDCGITAVDEVEYASSIGVDMIITDHHECKENVPNALAVVNPHRKDCTYPFKHLAGVGVALKVVMALGGEENSHSLFEEYSDLAAVGTIADVMKLMDENRTIVDTGLRKLKHTKHTGLYSLMLEAGTLSRTMNANTIGHCLSPRINAAGRMGKASTAVEMILTDDKERGAYLAHELCELNRVRQNVEKEILEECVQRVDPLKNHDCLVLSDKKWHQGVVGIVASCLSERFACPVFIICVQKDGKGKGSCRSYKGFNLFCALDQCSDLLEEYGGHSLAAGFTIREENIPAFRQRMEACVRANTGGKEMISTLKVDGEIEDTSVLTVEEVEKLAILEPYGAGNSRPIFSLSGVTVTCVADVGGGRHMKMRAMRDGRTMDMIFFSVNKNRAGLIVGDRADIAFYPQINEYRGSRTVQLHLVDIRPAESDVRSDEEIYRRFRMGEEISREEAEKLLPKQGEITELWRYLSSFRGMSETTIRDLMKKLERKNGVEGSYVRTSICLDVLEQEGLIDVKREGASIYFQVIRRGKLNKVEFNWSPVIKKLRSIAWESGAVGS